MLLHKLISDFSTVQKHYLDGQSGLKYSITGEA